MPTATRPTWTDDLRRIVAVLRRRYRPQRIILFGSAAWGSSRAVHDLDLVVVKATRASHARRSADVYDAVDEVARTYPLDILVYTPEEIQQRLGMGDSFVRRIVTEGKVLYDAAA